MRRRLAIIAGFGAVFVFRAIASNAGSIAVWADRIASSLRSQRMPISCQS
ncbi:hypothetical protein X773_13005 [Mesorhizobium sp. LSJC285A00]|nr:hypothetical protein X773_13005 [Mesorhizobium sp. LSJC285A00]